MDPLDPAPPDFSAPAAASAAAAPHERGSESGSSVVDA